MLRGHDIARRLLHSQALRRHFFIENLEGALIILFAAELPHLLVGRHPCSQRCIETRLALIRAGKQMPQLLYILLHLVRVRRKARM